MQPESLPRMCWYLWPALLPGAMLMPITTSVICDATASHVGIPVPCCNRRQCCWQGHDDAYDPIASWGYADVHIWFYHQRPSRSPWTELMPEAMLISMVNVVNAVTTNRVYVHKLSYHQSPYWCPQPMFIVYAVIWSYWFPWSGVPLENMWKNGVSSAAWERVCGYPWPVLLPWPMMSVAHVSTRDDVGSAT